MSSANSQAPASSWQGALLECAAEVLGDFADCEFLWIAMAIAVITILLYAMWAVLTTSQESNKLTIVEVRR
jgi:hypothetical protein